MQRYIPFNPGRVLCNVYLNPHCKFTPMLRKFSHLGTLLRQRNSQLSKATSTIFITSNAGSIPTGTQISQRAALHMHKPKYKHKARHHS